MNDLLDRLRTTWETLNPRERWLALLLGAVFGCLLLGSPMLLMLTANGDIEAENQTLRALLDDLAQKSGELQASAEARKLAEARFENKTPPLGSFLETAAQAQGLTIREVVDQPEKSVGKFHRRSVNVSIPGVGLSPVVNLLSSIDQSGHPVAIENLQFEHFQPGDSYNVKVGVVTYDKAASATGTTPAAGTTAQPGADELPGPPAPEEGE